MLIFNRTKDHLLSAIDGLIGELEPEEARRVVVVEAEEVLKRRPNLHEALVEQLARHGWGLVDDHLISLELFDPTELASLPDASRAEMAKAVQRSAMVTWAGRLRRLAARWTLRWRPSM